LRRLDSTASRGRAELTPDSSASVKHERGRGTRRSLKNEEQFRPAMRLPCAIIKGFVKRQMWGSHPQVGNSERGTSHEGDQGMTKDDRAEQQLKATREQAEGLLKCAVAELQSLLAAPKSEGLKWFPHGIDGVKISIKLLDVEATLELEGVQPAPADEDEE